jgi:putative ABC transport system permease protein
VANTRTETLTQTAGPEIYIPFLQCPVFTKHLIVRASTDPASLPGAIRGELRAIEPTVALEHVKTFDQIRADSMATQLFAMRMLIGFASTGGVLALVGIYSVLALSVRSRRRELAIRMAVGAPQRNILRLVIGEGVRMVVLGLILGVGVAIAMSRVLQALLFEVQPTDPVTWMAVPFLLAVVAILASWFPARHATRIEPSEALRHE